MSNDGYAPDASVNTRWVEKWDTRDALKFINVYQQREAFEGKGTAQFNNMTSIIKNKRISGKHIVKCDTIMSLLKLFDNKINSVTARVLLDALNMERNMYQKRELSKPIIKKGKWQPRIGERIRLVEMKHVPHRSYPAQVREEKQGKGIYITYDGYKYNEGEWLKRHEWAGRITILEDSNKPSMPQAQKLNKTTSVRNKMAQGSNDAGPKLGKRPKSVPPTDVPYVPPFRNKKVIQWNNDDVTDWIDSIEIKAPKNVQSKITQDKLAFKKAAIANQLNGKLLLDYKKGQKLYKDYKHHKISEAFCNKVVEQLKGVLGAEAAFGGPKNYLTTNVTKWSKKDLIEWVQSLDLQKEKKIIAGINQNDMTGKDFADCQNAQEIMDGFSVDAAAAGILFMKLKKLRKNTPQKSYRNQQASNPTDDNDEQPPPYSSTVPKDEFKNSLLQDQPPAQPVRVEFEVGQRIQGKDGGWHNAIIKQVGIDNYGQRCVRVGWLLDKWASERWDKVWTEDEWDKRIRDPETELPFSKLAQMQASGNQGGTGFVRYGKKQSGGGGGNQKGKAYKWKHIDQWTNGELQEWIKSLKLNNSYKKTVNEHVVEQEITGADFNSMSEISEIVDSFEIPEGPAKILFGALQQIRANSKDSNTSQVSNMKSGRGIIGLDNLRNTCFINSVIQSLLQTPGLITYLRQFAAEFAKDKSSSWFSWGSSNSSKAKNMLDAFIEVAAAAMQAGKGESIPPEAIVKYLRDSDVKFAYGEQGDALSAVSKMTELLDKQIIKRIKKKGKKGDGKKHTGQWHMELKDADDEHDEDEIIEGQFMLYNPYESVIREYIHFVERNVFTCLKCGWQEARYEIKEKILLPLEDLATKIRIDVYIPSIKKGGPVLTRHECVILGYCPIQTLRYQIFNDIRTSKDIECQLNDVDQISIRTLQVNKKNPLNNWVQECDAKEDCSTLTRTHKTIFAVVGSNKSNKNTITVTTFNVKLDKKGEADPKESYLEFDEMKAGSIKKFDKLPEDKKYPKKEMHIYFGGKIYDFDDGCRVTKKNSTIVVIWTNAGAKRRHTWLKPETSGIDIIWQCEIWNNLAGNNYSDAEEFITGKIAEYKRFAKTLDKATRTNFEKTYIEKSLSGALVAYQALANDQNKAIELAFEAFSSGKVSFMKKNPIVQDISSGFDTYCSTKVLDRGAHLKCRGKCRKKCEVFRQETKIVRFSDVLIFAIDRYINNSKFEDLVGYEEFETFDKQKYELYGVCNHSGTNNYGHYWAYVKGYDNNQWYEANDNRISKMYAQNVVGKDTAILLFYKKAK